jgi:hypothetical protein
MKAPHRRGDVHPETGKVFMHHIRNRGYWVTPEKYEAIKARTREVNKARPLLESPYKQGDVHPETGMVFLCRSRTGRGGVCWITPEAFKARKASGASYKRGDIHPETGLVSMGRQAGCKDGIYWVTPEKYEESKARACERLRARPKVKTAHRRGDIHPETGLVFMGRQAGSLGGLYWATPEQYGKSKAQAHAHRNTPEYRKRAREYVQKRHATEPMFALKARVRQRLAKAVGSICAGKKPGRSLGMVGCTWEELMAHIEKRFKPGMAWENRALWHVDHIIPLASAETEEELLRLCHYTNLQPLWAEENLKKSDRLPTL